MRLINAKTLQLEEFIGDRIPRYYILSHRWGDDEITYKDFLKGRRKESEGFQKILACCGFVLQWHERAATMGRSCYVWIDTCCIDKRSSAELSEAINSMYPYYWRADICFAYLCDVETTSIVRASPQDHETVIPSFGPTALPFAPWMQEIESRLARSSWFTRGWTLQELLAPRVVVFLDCCWSVIGNKQDIVHQDDGATLNLNRIIVETTGIDEAYLRTRGLIRTASIARRMSWAAGRNTTRIEDIAYCLLGIFGVNMPLLYGEGKLAFIRLQEELIRKSTDQSIFAWSATTDNLRSIGPGVKNFFTTGILAPSPLNFQDCAGIVQLENGPAVRPYAITNAGLELCTTVKRVSGPYIVTGNSHLVFTTRLNCIFEEDVEEEAGSETEHHIEPKTEGNGLSILLYGFVLPTDAILTGFSRLHHVPREFLEEDVVDGAMSDAAEVSMENTTDETEITRVQEDPDELELEVKTFYINLTSTPHAKSKKGIGTIKVPPSTVTFTRRM